MDPLTYYARQSSFTDPGRQADLLVDLPRDVAGLCRVVQGLVVHYRLGHLFDLEIPEERLPEIEELSDQFGRELIVVERPGLSGEVAVTSWHKRLLCGELVPAKVALFTREFKDEGPEKGFL